MSTGVFWDDYRQLMIEMINEVKQIEESEIIPYFILEELSLKSMDIDLPCEHECKITNDRYLMACAFWIPNKPIIKL